MSLIVETGAGILTAESYISVAACSAYALNRNLPFDTTDVGACEGALRRATSYIDQNYRRRFPGYRANRRLQALEWPRLAAFYYAPENNGPSPFYAGGFDQGYDFSQYDAIPINIIPIEITNATCEAAIREMAEPGVLMPDLERGGGVSQIKAGSVEVRYGGAATPNTVFQVIDAALSGLITQQSQYSSRSARV